MQVEGYPTQAALAVPLELPLAAKKTPGANGYLITQTENRGLPSIISSCTSDSNFANLYVVAACHRRRNLPSVRHQTTSTIATVLLSLPHTR